MSQRAKQAHRRAAILIGLFLAVHFATHFSALGGIAAQERVLQWSRLVYQFPAFEIALVVALILQVILGIKLLVQIRKRKTKDRWHWLQFTSGCYLAYFIVNHTSAALVTRLGFGLDTNFYWAAGTLTLAPIRFLFAPYYTLAVMALVGHLIAALHFRGPSRWHAHVLLLGPIAGLAIVAGYGGAFYNIELSNEYLDYFGAFPGVD